MGRKEVRQQLNRQCQCGSGRKAKSCCGALQGRAVNQSPPDPHLAIVNFLRAEASRRRAFGAGKPFITAVQGKTRFVAVGRTVQWSDIWQTVPDFLYDFIHGEFGKDWFEVERHQHEGSRHPFLNWRDSWYATTLQAQKIGTLFAGTPNAGMRSLLQLSWDLFVVSHNQDVQQELFYERLISRLRNRLTFQSARYEAHLAALLVKAGFDVQFIDDHDVSQKHPDFLATHRASGLTLLAEAKSKHRVGLMGFQGGKEPKEPGKANLRSLFLDALKKPVDRPYLILLEANVPVDFSPEQLRAELEDVVLRHHDSSVGQPALFSFLMATNSFVSYTDDQPIKKSSYASYIIPAKPKYPLPQDILNEISTAFHFHATIPETFDGAG